MNRATYSRRRACLTAAGMLVPVLALTAACSSSSSGSGTASAAPSASTTSQASASLAALVPQSVKSSGSITVGVIQSPPYSIIGANGAISGADNDLITAAAALLGLKTDFVSTTSEEVVTGLSAGRFDAVTDRGDFLQRHATTDTIDLQKSTTSGLVPASAASSMKAITDICGLNVGMQQGTITDQSITAVDKACSAAGKATVQADYYPSSAAMELAMRSGRINVVLDSVATNLYAAKELDGQMSNIDFTGTAGLPGFSNDLLGIAFNSSNKALATAFVQAFKQLISNGTYNTIFAKYGAAPEEVTVGQVKINGSDNSL
jgi:polar amino acid transport system substrate-binding protein